MAEAQPRISWPGAIVGMLLAALVLGAGLLWILLVPDLEWGPIRDHHPGTWVVMAGVGGMALALIEMLPPGRPVAAAIMALSVAGGWTAWEFEDIGIGALVMAVGVLTGSLLWRRAAIADREAIDEWKQ